MFHPYYSVQVSTIYHTVYKFTFSVPLSYRLRLP